MKRHLQSAFFLLGFLCLLLIIYGLFAPPHLSKEPLPAVEAFDEVRRLEPFEWRELDEDEIAANSVDRSGVRPEVGGWSLQVGELTTRAEQVARQQQQLRQAGFNAYIRRYRDTEELRYGLYIGPWLTLSSLQEARAAVDQAAVLKLPLKVVPYSVSEEHPPEEVTGIPRP